MKKILSSFMMILFLGIVNAQTLATIYSENVGTPSGNTNVNIYTGWSNTIPGIIYTGDGTCDVRTTSASTGYPTASGNGNVMINNTTKWFQISGINTSGYDNILLSFGLRKGTGADNGTAFTVQYSVDNASWLPLSFPALGSGAAWFYITITENIPATDQLYLKFSSTNTVEYRLDDIIIQGDESVGCNIAEGFEEAAWAGTGYGSYANRTVTDSYGTWSVSAVTQMTSGSDRYNGLRSARFRGNATDIGTALNKVEMLFDNPNGIKTVSFVYGSYAAHAGGIIHLEYSTDQGTTWNEVGSVTAPSWVNGGNEMQEASFNVNVAGNVRIRFTKESQTGSTSVNIDDLCITDLAVSNTVSTPTFSPGGGTYVSAQNITLDCSTSGASIYFTMDGTDPTSASTLYQTPILLDANGTFTIKAIAMKAGMDNSDIASATYILNIPEPLDCDFLEDFEQITGAGAYGGADVTFGSGLWRVVGFTTMDDNDRRNGVRSVRLRGNAGDSCHVSMLFDKPGGVEKLTFRYGSYSTHSNGQISAYYSTNQGATWNLIESFNALSWVAGGSGLQTVEYNVNIPGNIRIRIARDGALASSTSVNIDDICLTDFSGAIATPTFNPPGGNYLTPQSVSISCAITGATIRYTLDGSDPTETSTIYNGTPIPVSVTTTIKAKAWMGAYIPSSIATAVYSFPVEVPDIAAFKAENAPNATTLRYKITGDVTYVYRNGRNIYIKDASGGLLIFDNSPSTITHTYTNGDIISGGIIGTCTIYNGQYELIPVINPATGTPGAPVLPVTLTMANLIENFAAYESQLVRLEKITFAAGTFGTGGAANLNIYQNSSQMVCRNQFSTFTGYTTNPNTQYDVAGFAIPFNADKQIAPRDSVYDIKKTEYTVSVSALPTVGGSVNGGGTYHYNDIATIIATPYPAYNFINWTEGGTPFTTDMQFAITITENRTFVANFQMKTFTITSSAGPNGTIAPLGTLTFNYGASQTYTITPNLGYEIDQVLVNGVNNQGAVTSGSYSFNNITANHTIAVSFKLKQYTLTLNPSTGTVSVPSLPVTYNTAIGSIPNATQPNCIFKGWFIGATQIFPYTIWTWTSNQTALAVFDYPIVATNTNSTLGTITPSGTVNYSLGESATYTCTPIAGAHITTVVVDGITVFTGNDEVTASYTHIFTNINDYHTIQVGFAMNCYAMNPNNILGEGATVTMTPANCVQHGGNVTFTINSDCYRITQILVNGVDQGVTSGYTYSFVWNNVTGTLPLIEVSTELDQFSIMATPLDDPLGAIVPSGLALVNCGTNKLYEFVTETGFRVRALYVDDVSIPVPASRNYTFYNIHANHTIHVEFEEFPQFIIQFGPGAALQQGGSVFPTNIPNAVNYIAVDSGELSFPFSIVPAQGYTIDKVYVDNVVHPAAAISGTYSFTNVKAHHTIYATFKPLMFTITATADPNGTISPSGAVPVAYGNNQLFTAVPQTGYNLSAILVDGVLNVNATQTGVYYFTNVTENHTISASFVKKTYLITTSAGPNGTINPQNPMVPHGNNQTFTFLPQTGYKVDKVFVDGIENPSAAQAGIFTFFNVTQEHTISVTFTKIKFTITSTHTTGGTVTPAGTIPVDYGDHSPIYVFAAGNGYQIQSVLVDGVNNAQAVADGLYRFMDVTANHTIHVVFKADMNAIIATATYGGYISPSGVVNVPNGENKVFAMQATTGYELARVLVDGINYPDAVQNGYYVFFNVTDDHTIAAQFEKKKYAVSFPEIEGVHFTPSGGSTAPVEHGGKFMFTVDLQEGYTQSYVYVFANNIMLNPSLGVYIINNVTANQVVTISGLALNQYKIVAKATAGGTISPAGTFMVTHGDNKTFNIVPNANYVIKDVIVDGVSIGVQESYTFYDIRANAAIEAQFTFGQGIEITDDAAIQVFSHSNVVTIVNESLVSIHQVEILDMYGRIVWTGQAPDAKTEITLNVAKGIYGVRITTGDLQYVTTKVIIQ